MTRYAPLLGILVASVALVNGTAAAQYAVGHRTFAGGTSFGGGYSKMDYQFPTIDPDKPFYLLPTLELKLFFNDALSLDFSVPVVNIAASNALQDYFFFTAEAYLNFHPSAPSAVELFVAPGFGVAYASWKDEEGKFGGNQNGYAFHIPVRLGLEFNNPQRNFSVSVAARPFFALVRWSSSGGVSLSNR